MVGVMWIVERPMWIVIVASRAEERRSRVGIGSHAKVIGCERKVVGVVPKMERVNGTVVGRLRLEVGPVPRMERPKRPRARVAREMARVQGRADREVTLVEDSRAAVVGVHRKVVDRVPGGRGEILGVVTRGSLVSRPEGGANGGWVVS